MISPCRTVLAALFLVVAARAAGDGRSWGWRQTPTPHFFISHQNTWLPAGFIMGVERVHFRLRMDLGLFSPWMSKEKINLFVYADQESFLAGEFAPPRWSNGLAIYDRKAVALPAVKDSRKMLSVMAHETTHLLFDGYWRQARRAPPSWLSEGLAMLEEAESPERPETSVWYRQMSVLDPKSFPNLEAFFAVTADKGPKNDQAAVEKWYVQAYSVTHFLLRKHSRLQFKSFCAALREGKPVGRALWLTYRYRRVADLDGKWRAWLSEPLHKRRVALVAMTPPIEESAPGPTGLNPWLFKRFETLFQRPQAASAGQ